MAQSFDKFNLAREGNDWLFKLLSLDIVDIDLILLFELIGESLLLLFEVDSVANCC